MFLRPKSKRDVTEEIQPKFMGFLNEVQKEVKFKTDRIKKESIIK